MKEKIVDINTMGRLFLKRTQASANRNAVGWIEENQVRFHTFQAYRNIVEALSLGLVKAGFNRNHVAMISHTCKEWHFLDMATMSIGGVLIPIYPTLPPVEIIHLLEHSDATILIVENDSLFEPIITQLTDFKALKLIISIHDLSEKNKKRIRNSIDYISYADLLSSGSNYQQLHPDLFESLIKGVKPDDLASIIYTSGTTGTPKGAMLKHKSFITMLKNVDAFTKGAFNQDDRTLTFLPLSHVFGRVDSFLPLIFGWEMVFARSLESVIDDLKVVQPTIMLAVPRVLEKIYMRIQNMIGDKNPIKKNLFDLAQKASNNYFEKIERDQTPTVKEMLAQQIAFKTVFEKIYQVFGGKIRFFVSGGAPLSPQIIKFLRNAHLTILEGYGLTETAAPCFLNPVNKQIPGTVGRPIGDVRVKFDEENEIYIKSDSLFSGYYKDEKSTAEAFEGEWFKTGDIGHFIPDGFLTITDRKKDLIITSGGKNIAPIKVEGLFKTARTVKEAVVFGDKQNYLVALFTVDFSQLKSQISGLDHLKPHEIVEDPRVLERVQKDVDAVNNQLPSFEQIKKFRILTQDFNFHNYLTPSLKIKRKKLAQDYEEIIDSMFQQSFDN